MRRVAVLLAAAATASAIGVATAPAAGACMGLVCDEICHWWGSSVAEDVFTSPAVQRVLDHREGCPIE